MLIFYLVNSEDIKNQILIHCVCILLSHFSDYAYIENRIENGKRQVSKRQQGTKALRMYESNKES